MVKREENRKYFKWKINVESQVSFRERFILEGKYLEILTGYNLKN